MKSKRLIAIMSLTLFLLLIPTLASANAAGTNYFNGGRVAFGSSSRITSVYVDITTPSQYQTVGNNSGSCAWPMIVDRTSLPDTSYVQVGWTNDNNVGTQANGVHYFYEIYYGNVQNDYQVYSTVGPARGSTHGYRVHHEGPDPDPNSLGYWYGDVDGAVIANMGSRFGGHEAQYYEEIYGGSPYNAHFAGTSTNHVVFSNVRAYDSSTNTTYYSPSLSWTTDTDAGQNHSNYTVGNAGSTIEFWDTRD